MGMLARVPKYPLPKRIGEADRISRGVATRRVRRAVSGPGAAVFFSFLAGKRRFR